MITLNISGETSEVLNFLTELALAGPISAKLDILVQKVNMNAQLLQQLKDEVARETTLVASGVALIQGLAKQIEDNKDDPTALQALADSMKQNDDTLAQAIVDHTPAAPTSAS